MAYRILFYEERSGRAPVLDYMRELAESHSKDSRIKLSKIQDYIKALQENGTRLPETHCKHLDGEIWELRPIRDRILFAAWMGDSFVLLHSFMKQTQKTPRRELEQARRELDDFRKRWSENE